jgi:Ribosomal protein L7/L12 C-terminal domain
MNWLEIQELSRLGLDVQEALANAVPKLVAQDELITSLQQQLHNLEVDLKYKTSSLETCQKNERDLIHKLRDEEINRSKLYDRLEDALRASAQYATELGYTKQKLATRDYILERLPQALSDALIPVPQAKYDEVALRIALAVHPITDKIPRIKLYRELVKCGLKEAKDAIEGASEAWERESNARSAEAEEAMERKADQQTFQLENTECIHEKDLQLSGQAPEIEPEPKPDSQIQAEAEVAAGV